MHTALSLLLLLLPAPAAAAEPRPTDAASLQREARDLAVAVRDAKKSTAQLKKRYDAFTKWLAVQGPTAHQVVQSLLKDSSPEIRAFGAELLVWCAYGDRYRSFEATRPTSRTVVSTKELGATAAALTDQADPFLAGMGEWALATRLGDDYEQQLERQGKSLAAKAWPGKDAPPWYQRWIQQSPEEILRNDLVRQAVAAGAHRSSQALVESADDLVRRARGLTEYVRGGKSPAKAATAQQRLEKTLAARLALQQAMSASPSDVQKHRTLWLALRHAVRGVCEANPDIDFTQIVFALRRGDGGGGNITAGRANRAPPGGDILVKTGLSPADPVQALIGDRLGPGHVKGLELWFDGDRMVFAYAKQPANAADWEQAHLYEMNFDGSGLRQLTFGKFTTDQEPTYLPNGDIVFVSDRSLFGSQCAGALQQDNMILNLYRCDKDGGNLRPLSNNKDFDRHPHMMDNGQLLFLHWEYLDRHLWQTHTLWTCRPDGTLNDAFYKQHIASGPMSLREARQIRGQQKIVAVGCGHHNSDIGAVMLIDYTKGINVPEAMQIVTPGVSSTEGGYGLGKPVPEGAVRDDGGYYRFPYPLSDKSFLVSYTSDQRGESGYALYYIDVWGNKELIHRDLHASVAFLSPVRRVARPPMLPEKTTTPAGPERFARVYLHNVYQDLSGVARGTVKYLRIAQPMPWPCVKDERKNEGFVDLHYMSTTGWASAFGMWGWGASRAIGIVPVEEDGSAYFKAPVGQPVFFQALDKDYTEVRRMRSYVTFQEGESRSCIGCHESKPIAPPSSPALGMALRHDLATPKPPMWGDRALPDFETHVQPIFDRRCLSCHGEKNPDGGIELSARKIHHFNQSYRTLFGLKPGDPTPSPANGFWKFWYPHEPAPCDDATAKTILKTIHQNKHPGQLVSIAARDLGPEITPPMAFGSSVSRLTKAVLDHRRKGLVKDMTEDEWIGLVTWVDFNAQYWGSYVHKDLYFARKSTTCRRVQVLFADPWQAPPIGEWYWESDAEVRVRPANQAKAGG